MNESSNSLGWSWGAGVITQVWTETLATAAEQEVRAGKGLGRAWKGAVNEWTVVYIP